MFISIYVMFKMFQLEEINETYICIIVCVNDNLKLNPSWKD